jgi:hypothetical protein
VIYSRCKNTVRLHELVLNLGVEFPVEQHKVASVYIKDAFVGVKNEQFNSIKMHGMNNVKIFKRSV